jgi:hypothetical protein
MSDPNPPELEPIAPLGVPGAPGEPASDGEPAHKPVWKSWVAAGVVAAAFVGGGIVAVTIAGHGKDSPAVQTASATQQTPTYGGPNGNGPFNGRFGGRGAQGKITAIKGTTLTIDSTDFSGASTTMTVTTNADTKVTETVAGSVSDIAVGDNVLVVGESTDAAVTATSIVDNGDQTLAFRNRTDGQTPDTSNGSGTATPPSFPDDGQGGQGGPGFSGPGGRGGFTAGAVTSVDGSTITIRTIAGDTVTVTTTADTKVSVTKTIKLADLAVGDTVRVNGTTTGTTVAADSIEKGELGFGGGLRRSDGTGPDESQPNGGAVPGAATS